MVSEYDLSQAPWDIRLVKGHQVIEDALYIITAISFVGALIKIGGIFQVRKSITKKGDRGSVSRDERRDIA